MWTPSSEKKPQDPPNQVGDVDDDLEGVAGAIGSFIEYWGFRNIHGRIWSIIYLSPQPISTPEIIDKLGVSKALASRSINELLEFELIFSAGTTDYGRHIYEANEDVGSIVYNVLKNREMTLIDRSLQTLSQLASHDVSELEKKGVSPRKLDQLLSLTEENKGLLAAFLRKKFRTFPQWIRFSKRARGFLKL